MEILVVLGIISLLSSFVVFKYNKLEEQQDLEKAIASIENIVYRYSLKSLESSSSFKIKFNYKTKEISVNPNGKPDVIESIKLPSKLKYATIYNHVIKKEKCLSTNTNGNFSASFSIYVCGYDDAAQYRISFYSFNKSHLAKINIYKNNNKKKVKYNDLVYFHYDENEVKKGWIKL